ncbi:hypothetical protein [Microcoleus sp. FACHB-831]|nr:hypothetical protein [Microcoleus sp. FACHB-831]
MADRPLKRGDRLTASRRDRRFLTGYNPCSASFDAHKLYTASLKAYNAVF